MKKQKKIKIPGIFFKEEEKYEIYDYTSSSINPVLKEIFFVACTKRKASFFHSRNSLKNLNGLRGEIFCLFSAFFLLRVWFYSDLINWVLAFGFSFEGTEMEFPGFLGCFPGITVEICDLLRVFYWNRK